MIYRARPPSAQSSSALKVEFLGSQTSSSKFFLQVFIKILNRQSFKKKKKSEIYKKWKKFKINFENAGCILEKLKKKLEKIFV